MHQQTKYLLIKGKAGLGNRILCALTGIIYARLMDRRLVVDWSDFAYSNDGANVFPRLFALPEALDELPFAAHNSVRPNIWSGRLDMSAGDLIDQIDPKAHTKFRGSRAFSVEPLKLDYPEDILVMWSHVQQIGQLRKYFVGSFAPLSEKSDNEIMSWLLREVMVLHPDVAKEVDAWWEEHGGDRPVIGVHVRSTDRRIKSPLESFCRSIDKLLPKVPNATIFLATDDPAVQSAIESRYPKVCSTQKWFPTGGVSMHQNPECPDRLANAIEALRDMYILAGCDYIVFPSSSSFSFISSLVAKIPESHIIDVERGDLIIRIKKAAAQWIH